MNDKLECLKKLQEVLKEKFSLEDEVKSIPAHLREEEAKLESDRKKYEELKENLENLTKEHKSLAIRYEDASSQRIGYEKQVEFINTQREFEALAKQLEEAKILEQSLLKQKDSKEQELKALESDITELGDSIGADALKNDIDALEARVNSAGLKNQWWFPFVPGSVTPFTGWMIVAPDSSFEGIDASSRNAATMPSQYIFE